MQVRHNEADKTGRSSQADISGKNSQINLSGKSSHTTIRGKYDHGKQDYPKKQAERPAKRKRKYKRRAYQTKDTSWSTRNEVLLNILSEPRDSRIKQITYADTKTLTD